MIFRRIGTDFSISTIPGYDAPKRILRHSEAEFSMTTVPGFQCSYSGHTTELCIERSYQRSGTNFAAIAVTRPSAPTPDTPRTEEN